MTSSSLLGAITLVERQARQERCQRLLGEILKRARQEQLPIIDWQVSEFALVGSMTPVDNSARHKAFTAWADALHLDRHDDRADPVGYVHLHAFSKDWEGSGLNVAVLADVWADAPVD